MDPDQSALQLRKQDLVGKTAVVTGASKGIGRTIALKLACRGCSILGTCSSSTSVTLIDSIADEISRLYSVTPKKRPKICGIVADVRTSTCHRDAAESIEQQFAGHVDIFVNNAAPITMVGIGSLDAEYIQTSCHANIQSPALMVDELVKRKMFRKDSRIVFISSARGRKVNHKTPMYCVTKSAGECLVRCWAEAFGGKDPEFEFMAGTTANSVMVGLTRTEAVKRHDETFLDKMLQEVLPSQAIPRVAEPEDVADIVGLLCSHEARWITGSVVSADGGGIKIL